MAAAFLILLWLRFLHRVSVFVCSSRSRKRQETRKASGGERAPAALHKFRTSVTADTAGKRSPGNRATRARLQIFTTKTQVFFCNGAQRWQNSKRLLEPSLGWEKWMQRLVKENFLTIPHTIRVEERLSRGRRWRGGRWRRRMRRQAIMSVNSK